MIYICCKRIPADLSLAEAENTVTSFFSGDSNASYFEQIKSRIAESAKESLAAYSLLASMICKCFPAENKFCDSLILSRGINGKPYFSNSHLKFSISHSKGIVACAISDDDEVGIDVEASTIVPEKAQKFAARYFNSDEQTRVRNDPEQFYKIWTEKEAASKLLGENLADHIKKSQENSDFTEISFHKFRYREYPITLCTKRNCGKIILLDDNIE